MGANAFIPQGPRATSATTSSKGERLAILSIAAAAVLAACVYYGAIVRGEVLYSTSSPDGKYKIEIVQTRDFTLYERWVYMTALRNGRTTVNRKLLYTGDMLDGDFRSLYPNPRWTSNSTLELGDLDFSPDERTSELKVMNETSSILSYVLIESGWRKLVILEIEPKSTVEVQFAVRGGLSCEGGDARSNKRFGIAAAIIGNDSNGRGNSEARPSLNILIRIRASEATMESPQVALQPEPCCASDRPDYEHE